MSFHARSAVMAGKLRDLANAKHAQSPRDKPYLLVRPLNSAARHACSSSKTITSKSKSFVI